MPRQRHLVRPEDLAGVRQRQAVRMEMHRNEALDHAREEMQRLGRASVARMKNRTSIASLSTQRTDSNNCIEFGNSHLFGTFECCRNLILLLNKKARTFRTIHSNVDLLLEIDTEVFDGKWLDTVSPTPIVDAFPRSAHRTFHSTTKEWQI